MARSSTLTLLLLAAVSTGCFYSYGTADLTRFDDGAISILRLPHKPRNLGQLRAVARASLFGSCDRAIEDALEKLLASSRARGGNRVDNIQFRARIGWVQDPICRRNLNFAWLILPAFLPIPTSVTIRGNAIHDPRFELQQEVSAPTETGVSTRPAKTEQGSAKDLPSLCEARWTVGPKRLACQRRQLDAYQRIEPAVARFREGALTPESKLLTNCYQKSQLAHGTDWEMVEVCYTADAR